MANGKITSTDVAKVLGVSQSMVSRAFNPNASVAEDKRKKIIEGARKLGYTPNALARSLISNRSGLIAIIASSEQNPIYDEITRQLTLAIQMKGSQSVLCLVSEHNFEVAISKAIEYQVDGMVIACSGISSVLLQRCIHLGIRISFINQYHQGVAAQSFCSDNEQIGRDVGNYLIDRGYQKIAYLAGDKGSMVNEERWAGLRSSLFDRNAEPPLYLSGSFSFQSGITAAEILPTKPQEIDAVFCASDIIAIGLIEGLKKTPDYRHVAIIGVDNIPMASWPSFELTTVEQPLPLLVKDCINALFDQIHFNRYCNGQYHYYRAKIVERKTT
ncbi:LacI family DNA-binding transcriptional regulator [Vibrio sp. WXL210]|uniref:LacI family DNA-binding transcriptional regulator n=1 Tax=Vibrio sp. WXL210 TaxID=3450709 RepID=UPI003EC75282